MDDMHETNDMLGFVLIGNINTLVAQPTSVSVDDEFYWSSTEGDARVKTMVDSFVTKRFEDLSEFDAVLSGFTSVDQLKDDVIKRCGPIEDKEYVKVIRFSVI